MNPPGSDPDCGCMGAGPMLTQILRRLGPSESVSQHFRAAQLEILKGLRAMLDEHIAALSEPAPHGTKIPVEQIGLRPRLPPRWREGDTLALTATIYKFDIDLADSDRHVYETLSVQAARHPSESEPRLVARVLAYALEFTDGIAFSRRGLSEPDEPAIAVRDLTGAMRVWIDIGVPDAARLHKAGKAAPRVAIYTHQEQGQRVGRLAGERIHRAEAIELYAIDRALVGAFVARLERRMELALSVADRELCLSVGTETLTGPVVRLPIG